MDENSQKFSYTSSYGEILKIPVVEEIGVAKWLQSARKITILFAIGHTVVTHWTYVVFNLVKIRCVSRKKNQERLPVAN